MRQDHLIQDDSNLEEIVMRLPLTKQAKLMWAGVKPAQTSEIRHNDHMAQHSQHSVSWLTRSPKQQADTCLQPLHMLEGQMNQSQHCVKVQTQIDELLAGHQI